MTVRPTLSLSPQHCDKCMRCLKACRQRAIQVGGAYVFIDWTLCDGCGECVSACDTGAIRPRATARAEAAAAVSGGSASPRLPAAPRPGLAAVRDAAGFDAAPRRPALDHIAPLTREWSPWEVAAVLAGVAVLFAGRQAVLDSSWMTTVVPMGAKPLMRSGVLLLYYAAQLALLAMLGYRKSAGFAEAFGLRRFRPEATWMLGVLGAVLALRVGALAYGVAAQAMGWAMPAGPLTDITTYFGRDSVGLALTVVMIVIVGPFFEELVFRGVLLGWTQERFGAVTAIWVSALAFAAFHFNAWMFLPVMVMGLAAGWFAVRSRSLWVAYALHLLYNAVPVFFAFALAR